MKIAVGLSGGVDSAVTALLLKRAGHEVAGVTMKLWRDGIYKGGDFDACFGPGEKDDIAAAEDLARRLGIPFEVCDCSEEYEREIVGYFRSERAAGRTPNPCVVCNRRMKFGLLPRLAAKRIDFDRFATGHYARLAERDGRRILSRAACKAKDQSYFLWGLSQEQLAMAMFPLGELSKDEVRKIAREAGLPMSGKEDSQDFYSGDPDDLVGLAPRKGEIVDLAGRTLAMHDGFWNFTIGQRKGLGFAAGEPMYVCAIDACRNRVVVGPRAQATRRSFRVDLSTLNAVSAALPDAPAQCTVKVRSTGDPKGPVLFRPDGTVEADCGIFGVAPGQSAVFYDPSGEDVLFGAVIADGGQGPEMA